MSLNILSAYDLGIQIQDFVVDGVVDVDILAADLNGSGETVNGVTVDTVRFLTLDDASTIAAQETRLTQSLGYAKTGLDALAQGATSEFFDIEFSQYYSLAYGVDVLEELQQALTGMTTMTTFDTVFNLNLDEFFSNPPDGASVSVDAGDPAIVNSTTGEVELVESYFQTYFTDIAEF